jgi:hypothetical protein
MMDIAAKKRQFAKTDKIINYSQERLLFLPLKMKKCVISHHNVLTGQHTFCLSTTISCAFAAGMNALSWGVYSSGVKVEIWLGMAIWFAHNCSPHPHVWRTAQLPFFEALAAPPKAVSPHGGTPYGHHPGVPPSRSL